MTRPGNEEATIGPLRISPGRLAVSRAFGDPHAKVSTKGGNPNVLIAVPEIEEIDITDDHDFILMATDGIFDKLQNREVVNCAWNILKKKSET